MIDYVLTAAVGISAGVGALVSALPRLQPHTLGLCLLILVLLTLVNMRGVRDTGVAFLVPTYLFVGCLLIVIVLGIFHLLVTGGHPVPVMAVPHLPPATATLTLWLLAKVFASGCTAMTGVEAVSNGVMAFREPTTANARRTLTIIIALLIVLLLGIAFMCRAYGIGATDPEGSGLSERAFAADDGGCGTGNLLLRDHWFHPAGAFAFRQHCLCRFPPAHPGGGHQRLSAPSLPRPRPPAVVLRWSLLAGLPHRRVADSLSAG